MIVILKIQDRGEGMDFKLQQFNVPMEVTALANIHYFEFTKEFHSRENSHDFCELLYVDNGEIEVYSDSFKGVLHENELIIHPPKEKHSLKGSGGESPNVIIIGFECKSTSLLPFAYTPVKLGVDHKKLLSKIMQEGMSVFEPPYDIPYTVYMKKRSEYPFGTDQMLKISLETFLITLVRDFLVSENGAEGDVPAASRSIENIHKYISEHYTEKICLNSLCFIFGTNKTSLCREFKNTYGMTVLEYVHHLRIKYAKKMLRSSEMSVTQMSEILGFDSVHYFSRLFKRHIGVSPTEYSKSIKSSLE